MRSTENVMTVTYDINIPFRTGVKFYADIFRLDVESFMTIDFS
jgi:hypothetical protein